jgi:dienelactone hydrolase
MIGSSRPVVGRVMAELIEDGEIGRRDRKYILLYGGAIQATVSEGSHIANRHVPPSIQPAASSRRTTHLQRQHRWGAAAFLRAQPHSNSKVGVIGFCSGGRQAYLAACRIANLDAVVDCRGGNVIVGDPSKLSSTQPVAPIELTERIRCPLLGLFGSEDTNPSPDDVNRTEAALKRFGKSYEFHRYEGAGHAFFAWYRPNYRPE